MTCVVLYTGPYHEDIDRKKSFMRTTRRTAEFVWNCAKKTGKRRTKVCKSTGALTERLQGVLDSLMLIAICLLMLSTVLIFLPSMTWPNGDCAHRQVLVPVLVYGHNLRNSPECNYFGEATVEHHRGRGALGDSIVDIGGNFQRHQSFGRRVHCCAPIIDSADVLRQAVWNPKIKQGAKVDKCANPLLSQCHAFLHADIYMSVDTCYYLSDKQLYDIAVKVPSFFSNMESRVNEMTLTLAKPLPLQMEEL